MPNRDARFHNKCATTTKVDDKMSSSFKIPLSEWKENTEQIIDSDSEIDDLKVAQCYSHASSVYNDSDSECSSWVSDGKEDQVDGTVGLHFDCFTVKNISEKCIDIKRHICTNCLLTRDRHHVCSELATSGTLANIFSNLPLETNTVNEVNSIKVAESVPLHRFHRSVSLNNVCSSSSRNPSGLSRRQRTGNANSLVVFESQAQSVVVRSRRQRPRDINNNNTGNRDLSVYLRKPIFKLQDCFQNQGLLSLVACISYTVFLMIVFCVIGLVLDSIKSVIGTQNLKDMRENIVHSRRTRTTMSCG